MIPYFATAGVEIFHGDCRDVLRALPAASVQTCVTSPPSCKSGDTDAVERLGTQVEFFAPANELIGQCAILDGADGAVLVREVAVTDNPCSVLDGTRLKTHERERESGLAALDAQKRQKCPKDSGGFLVGGLVAEQGTPAGTMFLFWVVPPANRFGEQPQCGFLDHANEDGGLVDGSSPALAAVRLALLDSDAAFAVNDSGEIRERFTFGHKQQHTPRRRGCGNYKWNHTFKQPASTSIRVTAERYCGGSVNAASSAALPRRRTECFGLRDYGTATWEGGDPSCDHTGAKAKTRFDYPLSGKQQSNKGSDVPEYGMCCPCGARRIDQQIGLEPTPAEYVATMVKVFREVRRVLRDDGTVWLNLGDSFWSDTQSNRNGMGSSGLRGGNVSPEEPWMAGTHKTTKRGRIDNLKPKDLIGIPWSVAFALRDDGWYLRSDIIWHKPNPMPESVTDRPTKAHEYLFLLAKSERYYYDADAIREPVALETLEKCETYIARPMEQKQYKQNLSVNSNGGTVSPNAAWSNPDKLRRIMDGRNKRSVWTVNPRPFTGWTKTVRWVRVVADAVADDTRRIPSADCPVHGHQDRSNGVRANGFPIRSRGTDAGPVVVLRSEPPASSMPRETLTPDRNADSPDQSRSLPATGRSKRTRKTDPAPETISPCTPSGESGSRTGDTSIQLVSVAPRPDRPESNTWPGELDVRSWDQIADHTVGISSPCSPACTCGLYRKIAKEDSHFATFPPDLIEPCILAGSKPGDAVLDPFNGSGTTGEVCQKWGRRYVGIELNQSYIDLSAERFRQHVLFSPEVA